MNPCRHIPRTARLDFVSDLAHMTGRIYLTRVDGDSWRVTAEHGRSISSTATVYSSAKTVFLERGSYAVACKVFVDETRRLLRAGYTFAQGFRVPDLDALSASGPRTVPVVPAAAFLDVLGRTRQSLTL